MAEPPAHSHRPSPTQPANMKDITQLVKAAGLLEPQPLYYTLKIFTNLGMLAAAWTAFALLGDSWWQLATAACLAFCFGQTSVIGHDAGHRQIGRTRKVANLVGYLHANVLTGTNFHWWIGHHTKHHNFPNHLSLDPDIQRRQVIFDPAHHARKKGTVKRFIIRHQGWMFYVLIPLEGLRLNLAGYIAAYRYAAMRKATTDLILCTTHLVAYLTLLFSALPLGLAVSFLAVHQGLFGVYVGLLFAPNHKGMPLRDGQQEEQDWLPRQVLSSRNLAPNRLTDFFYAGLNYQIEHHLFPTMPRRSLHKAQPLVKRYVLTHGLPYTETSPLRSYRDITRFLTMVSHQVPERADSLTKARGGAQ
ncbi:acyl-CoA desaturase [Streptomyces flavofungini]|uniref:Acyl-CoA desaturase n=2 Tax=Streptomyces flavofungini TaxID=68200 RepID=A0ABS0XJ56_9ACTN|nr:acyl-CoA desaturase [Streptomyces flavofungini]